MNRERALRKVNSHGNTGSHGRNTGYYSFWFWKRYEVTESLWMCCPCSEVSESVKRQSGQICIVVLTLSNTFFKLNGSLEVGKEKCSDKNQSALKPRKSWESWVSAAGGHEFIGWTQIKKLLDWLQLGLCPIWVMIF